MNTDLSVRQPWVSHLHDVDVKPVRCPKARDGGVWGLVPNVAPAGADLRVGKPSYEHGGDVIQVILEKALAAAQLGMRGWLGYTMCLYLCVKGGAAQPQPVSPGVDMGHLDGALDLHAVVVVGGRVPSSPSINPEYTPTRTHRMLVYFTLSVSQSCSRPTFWKGCFRGRKNTP